MTRHPVEALLRHHAHFGTMPTVAEIKDLDLSAADAEKVRQAAREAVELRDAGERGKANERAYERSREIIDALPAHQRHPRYAHRDPLANVDDPAELAAQIHGHGDLL